MDKVYKSQVKLLLDVLPEVAKEDCFAMHGGTAINLFVRDMPRLSVDIDLTYIPIKGRTESINEVNNALIRIKESIIVVKPKATILHKEDVCKLLIADNGAQIKIEVNMVGRGVFGETYTAQLCDRAQEQFDVFCSMPLVSMQQLYGGKLCAALDRQHPRDLFDVRLLLDNEGFTDDIKKGFVLALVSSNRPTHEILNPRFQDQRITHKNQFIGMTEIDFPYSSYEATRLELVNTIRSSLTDTDKSFLLSVNRADPDWSIYNFQNFPAVKWKLSNLATFIDIRQQDHTKQYQELQKILVSE